MKPQSNIYHLGTVISVEKCSISIGVHVDYMISPVGKILPTTALLKDLRCRGRQHTTGRDVLAHVVDRSPAFYIQLREHLIKAHVCPVLLKWCLGQCLSSVQQPLESTWLFFTRPLSPVKIAMSDVQKITLNQAIIGTMEDSQSTQWMLISFTRERRWSCSVDQTPAHAL